MMTRRIDQPRRLTPEETGLSQDKIDSIQATIAGDREFGSRVRQIILFGSRAKGSWREGSDIDIAVAGTGIPVAAAWRWADELEEQIFPWSVDCVIITAETDPALLAHIHRVGIVLYEQA